VIAWQRPASVARATGDDVFVEVPFGADGAVWVAVPRTGGLQILQGSYLAAASFSGMGMALYRSELQPAR
jgi:hypothetical protein